MKKSTKEKISKKMTGRKLSQEVKDNIGRGNLGIPRPKSDKQRKKIGDTLRKRIRNGEIKTPGIFNKGRHYSKEHRENIKKGVIIAYDKIGRKTPLNEAFRKSSMFRIWRELVFQRDGFICQNPNCEFCHNLQGVYLHPHHIKSFARFPELRFRVDNGITYCKGYHLNSGLHNKNNCKEVIGK